MKQLTTFTLIMLLTALLLTSCETQDNTALLKSIGEVVVALDSSFEQRGDFQDSLAVETLNVLTEITQRLEKNIILKDSIEWNIEQRDSIEWEIDYRDTTIYDTNRVEIPDTTWKPVILFTVSPKDTAAEGGKDIVVTLDMPDDPDLGGFVFYAWKDRELSLDIGLKDRLEYTLPDTGLWAIALKAYILVTIDSTEFPVYSKCFSDTCYYNCIGE